MINTVIIQNTAAECVTLEKALLRTSSELKIDARLFNVKDSIQYMSTHDHPDIIFTDIQLSDGLSFDIFNYTGITVPSVFISNTKNFGIPTTENMGIDYILKPFKRNDLERSLKKFNSLRTYFSNHQKTNVEEGTASFYSKKRLLVTRGPENYVLRFDEIAYIFTQNKVVFVMDHALKKYISDKTLNELEDMLPKTIFFRANRQYLINVNFIRSYRTFERVKVQVDLNIHEPNQQIIVSQKNAPHFKRWMLVV